MLTEFVLFFNGMKVKFCNMLSSKLLTHKMAISMATINRGKCPLINLLVKVCVHMCVLLIVCVYHYVVSLFIHVSWHFELCDLMFVCLCLPNCHVILT